MSHIKTIDLTIPDNPDNLTMFAEACTECGLEFMEGQRTHHWFGTFVGDTKPPKGMKPEDYGKCEHAVRVKGSTPQTYEIGLVRLEGEEGFRMAFDYWQGGYGLCEKIGGNDAAKLRTIYADKVAAAQMRNLQRQGFRVTESREGGKIRYRATR